MGDMVQSIRVEDVPLIVAGMGDQIAKVRRERDRLAQLWKSPQEEEGDVYRVLIQQCREFVTALEREIQEGKTALDLHHAFSASEGFAASLARVEGARQHMNSHRLILTCKQADGYQQFLASPEEGLKAVIAESIQAVKPTAENFVQHTFDLLSKAVYVAAEISATGRESCGDWMLQVVHTALKDWTSESTKLVRDLMDMHSNYVTADFFRKRREMRKAGSLYDSDLESVATDDNRDDDETPPPKTAVRRRKEREYLNYDILQGYLSKQNTKGAWQRRWFVLNEQKKRLYYYANQDEHQEKPPRGTVVLEDCIIEEMPSITRDASKLGIMIRHRDRETKIMKEHGKVLLLCEDEASKYEWLARLAEAAKSTSGKVAALSRHMTADSSTLYTENGKAGSRKYQYNDRTKSTPDLAVQWDEASDFPEYEESSVYPDVDEEAFYLAGSDWKSIAGDISAYVAKTLGEIAVDIPKAIVHTLITKVEQNLLGHLTTQACQLPERHCAKIAQACIDARKRPFQEVCDEHDRLQSLLLALQNIQVEAASSFTPAREQENKIISIPRAIVHAGAPSLCT